VADARHRRALRRFLEELLAAERVANDVGVHDDRRFDGLRRDPRRRLAQDLPELTFELANAGLARVLGDDRLDHGVRDRCLVLQEPVPLPLPRPEVVAGDRGLLVDGVAVEANDFHAIEQRAGDRVRDVSGRDEEHVRQVELDVEVMVAERMVLRRVQHLEQRGRRVAAPVGADLVRSRRGG